MKNIDIPLRYIETNDLENDLPYILNNIDHSLFGIEIGINHHGVNKFIIAPPYLYKNGIYNSVGHRMGQFKEYNYYEGYLSKAYFMPLRIDLNGNFEKQIELLKEIIELDEDIIIICLLKRKYNWKEIVIEQYKSYLKGNDTPSNNKLVRNLQEKTITGLYNLGNYEVNRQYSIDVEEKIVDDGFNFQLKVLIKSSKTDEFINTINEQLINYDSYNGIRLIESEMDNNIYSFTDKNQMLSMSEIRSLFGGKVKYEENVVEDTGEVSTETQSNNIIELLPYLEKEEIKVDETLVKRLEESLKRTKVTNQARLYNATIQSGSRLTIIQGDIPPNKNITDIKRKQEDIQAELGVQSLGIEQGDKAGTVKFSIPNNNQQIISLREMIERKDFQEFKKDNPLAFIVGMDELNNPIYLSLVKLVHLLVAGTTGSGKSVFVNTILTVLLMNHKPDELKMFLIDPKQVEFNQYKDFPHVQRVVTDMREATTILESVVIEMEKRYEKFSKLSAVKNISDYNKQSKKKLPYIIFAIDEFADLMLVSPEVEDYIMRLGQKARAAGIHLIIATQRPSADILSGKIKANLQNAISFNLGSNRNYRTVFDQGIGYTLLGQGDGVMRIENYPKEFQRLQSSIIHTNSEEEGKVLDKLVNYYKDMNYPIGEEIVIQGEEQEIPLIDQLKRLIANTGETRIKPLREKLGVRALKMTELMNELVEEKWLLKHDSKAKGYELIVDKEILNQWKDDE